MSLFEPSGPPVPRRVTLVRLASELARSLGALGLLAVEGEVHRPTTSRGGWVFFTLRDRVAQIDVKVPKANSSRCRVVGGERVCVVGTLEWSHDRGQLQLVAKEVTPVGAGAVAALIEETRRLLGAEGLLDRPRRPIPVLPAAIGVVCGAEAAVRKDIESVAADRFAGYPVFFEETTVSGPGASDAIVEALHRLTRRRGVEVVILARGGGDPTALLPWSSEEVCRAVAACPLPVVSAIGHDGDHPLVDEVADLRCGTPSMAAAAVVPELTALTATADGHLDRAARSMLHRLEDSRRRAERVDTARSLRAGLERADVRLAHGGARLRALHPAARVDDARRRLAACQWRRPMWERIARAEGRLGSDRRHLRALGPQRVLGRGYAIVQTPAGQVLRRAQDVSPGDPIEVVLAQGRLSARVEQAHPDPDSGPAVAGGRAAAVTTGWEGGGDA